MRRLLVVLLGAMAVLLTSMVPASAVQTGTVCNTLSHLGWSEGLCITVYTKADTYPNGSSKGSFYGGFPSTNDAKVVADYVRLWQRNADGTFTRIATHSIDGTFARGVPFTYETDWKVVPFCQQSGEGYFLYAEVSFHLVWPDGIVGPQRDWNSDVARCST